MNPFGGDDMAAGYATSRPAVHPRVMDRVRGRIGDMLPAGCALDVGCGAGLSTRAMEGWATICVGMEPAPRMLQWAKRTAPDAQFIAGAAEAMPLRDRSVDLMTAAGSLNYVRLDAFFAEAARVLQGDGVVVAYDFSPGRSFRETSRLDEWFDVFLRRYPHVKSESRPLSPTILAEADARFRVDASEYFEIAIPLTAEFYVDYMMTETNVAAAIRGGVPFAEIRRWCVETLGPVWDGGAQDVLFRGYFACMRMAG